MKTVRNNKETKKVSVNLTSKVKNERSELFGNGTFVRCKCGL